MMLMREGVKEDSADSVKRFSRPGRDERVQLEKHTMSDQPSGQEASHGKACKAKRSHETTGPVPGEEGLAAAGRLKLCRPSCRCLTRVRSPTRHVTESAF